MKIPVLHQIERKVRGHLKRSKKKGNVFLCGKGNRVISTVSGKELRGIPGLSIRVKGDNNTLRIDESKFSGESSAIIFGNSNSVLFDGCRGNYNISFGFEPARTTTNHCSLSIGDRTDAVGVEISLRDDGSFVEIGKDCMLSANINLMCTDNHAITDLETGEILNKARSIIIGDHVWVGLNAVILKDTKISDGSVVGINSVVTKAFVEENVIIGGMPAKILKRGIQWHRALINELEKNL